MLVGSLQDRLEECQAETIYVVGVGGGWGSATKIGGGRGEGVLKEECCICGFLTHLPSPKQQPIFILPPLPLPPPLTEGESPGLTEEEMTSSMGTLNKMAQRLNCECLVLRERREEGGVVVDVLLRSRVGEKDFMEIRWVGRMGVKGGWSWWVREWWGGVVEGAWRL